MIQLNSIGCFDIKLLKTTDVLDGFMDQRPYGPRWVRTHGRLGSRSTRFTVHSGQADELDPTTRPARFEEWDKSTCL